MKKGFTLLEMLAVLVLLLVVVSIVVPQAVKRTNKAEEDTISANVLSYVKEIETSVVRELGEENGVDLVGLYQVSNGVLTKDDTNYPVNLSGTLPNSGSVTINENGKVTDAILNYEHHQAVYDGKEVTVTYIENES